MKPSPDDIIGITEASRISGIPVTTLRDNARKGYIPASRLGRDWAFRRGDVLAFEHRAPGRPKVKPRIDESAKRVKRR